MPSDPAPRDDDAIAAIEAHIVAHLGTPDIVLHELTSDLVHLDLLRIPPTADRPCLTFVTTGMSDRPMNVPPDEGLPPYAELMISLPADWPCEESDWHDERNYWPLRLLKDAARLTHRYDGWLGRGHTLQFADDPQPFAEGTALCAALIVPSVSVPSAFWQLEVRPDKLVQFYALMPIYAEELAYKIAHGAEALLARFDAADLLDVIDPHRPNVCTA